MIVFQYYEIYLLDPMVNFYTIFWLDSDAFQMLSKKQLSIIGRLRGNLFTSSLQR